MKILGTGGSGFIGSRLVGQLLEHGHEPLIFDHDAVFNLAAEHRDDVRPLSLYDEVNVGGARNLVRACEETGCKKIVFTSTVAVYPLSRRNAGYPSENTPPGPSTIMANQDSARKRSSESLQPPTRPST